MTYPPHQHNYMYGPTAPPPSNPVADTIRDLSDQLFGSPSPYGPTAYEMTDYTHHTVGSSAGSSSTFAPPAVGGSSEQFTAEIQPIEEEPSASTPPGPKKRKAPRPKYNAPWWRYFEQTIDPTTGKCISARCKVRGCHSNFKYDDNNSSMSRHAQRHQQSG